MKALRFVDGKPTLAELDPPEPADGEALVRVLMAGICRTDIEIARGYMGFSGTLGHELIGRVEECADANWLGARVAALGILVPKAHNCFIPSEARDLQF